MISGFHQKADENCTLLVYYMSSVKFSPTCQSHLQGSRIQIPDSWRWDWYLLPKHQ